MPYVIEVAVPTPDQHAPAIRPEVPCAHCNLPVPDSRFVEGAERLFCCTGCEAVWQILHECNLEEYYRLRRAYEEKPAGPAKVSGKSFAHFDDPAYLAQFTERRAGGLLVRLYLEGVHCVACSWLVEKILLEHEHANFARLDLGRSTLEVLFNPANVKLSAIARALDRIGYTPHPIAEDEGAAAQRHETRTLLARLGIAAASSMNIMLLAVSQYAGDFTGIETGYSTLFRWVSFGLALPAVLYSAWPYYRGAWNGLKRRMLHMDLPISLGIIATFIFSTIATIQNRGDVYYDSVTGLIALLLGGRLLLLRAGRLAAEASESLLSRVPRTVKRVEHGKVREILLTEVRVGDLLQVLPGETIPVDGTLETDKAFISEAHLTGESFPIPRLRHEPLYAGATVVRSPLELTATAVGETTRLSRMVDMMRQASARRAGIITLMDRIAGWFVGAVLVLALATAVFWLFVDPSRALWNTAALMVVACPCALGLATPVALAMAMGRCAKYGVFVKSQDGIERLASVDHVILDKTGTLTEGAFLVVEQMSDADIPMTDYTEILEHVAALERHSGHVMATAFERVTESADRITECRIYPGSGLEGRIGGHHYLVGSEELLKEWAVALPPRLKEEVAVAAESGGSPVWVVRDLADVLVVMLRDCIRIDASNALSELRRQGLGLELLSGDHPQAVGLAAAELGIKAWRGRQRPEDKLVRVEELLTLEKRVAMVGDGVNDAAALSRATVGISAAGAAEVARNAADVFISTTSGATAIADAFRIARRAMRIIRWNLGIALAYNVVGVALAMAGLINPLLAAVFMPLSSLTVLVLASRA